MKFHEKLQTLRVRQGYTRAEVAYLLGMHPYTYAKLEQGKATPRKSTVLALRQILSKPKKNEEL